MIERLQVRPYELPLRRAWASARGGFARRRGWLIQASAEGLHGYGDCAPLPAAGTETSEAAWEALCQARACALSRSADTLLESLARELATAPAARFALECALLDLASRRRGLPLRRWLSDSARDEVPVNALLGALGTLVPADLQTACDAGFRVLKIKVGIHDPTAELKHLVDLARHLPSDIGLRLDANGAWEPDVARRLIDGLNSLPIESLEEPLRNPDSEMLTRLQAGAAFPLARDESLHGLGTDLDPATLGVRRIVLKPAALGGLARALALSARARAAGIEVVVTGLVDSAAGLWPTAQLAAAIGSPIPHGLATADWLAADLGPAPRPRLGQIDLPRTAGSGFEPSP
ncbi:o-succinylbenzoate synthase [uncultured Thiocystis sp.]|uniref:o-succinylbenzoate synthase n=1 Tax=uncultured Thiocystis sp. TaxID=1202134 RepID=UPI0025D6B2B0|nr:o-succinylbenzoate synthase [uncultured Thiocystis sp.]